VRKSLGHYIENTGRTDLVFMEIFKADRYDAVPAPAWLAHTRSSMVAARLNPDPAVIAKIPATSAAVMPA
jgi:oxalate decarboxylase